MPAVARPDLVSISQAANRLSCSATWIRKLIARGALAAESTPYGRCVLRESLEEYARLKGLASKGQVGA